MTEAILTQSTPLAVDLIENMDVDAALFADATAGLLILTDSDRADFLHRMTTNEINRLQLGQATVTVLTSPTARILQVFTVLSREESLWLLPAPGEASALARHLQGQIFFMDKVKVQNASDDYRRLHVMGRGSAGRLGSVGLAVNELPAETWIDLTWQETTVTVLHQQAYGIPGFELLVPASHADELQRALQDTGIELWDAAAYDEQRIVLGRPAPGQELTEEYNPLEAGLAWTCADNKGCYTGQEIIARQITYDKITKSLVGLRSATPLAVGEKLMADGRNVGTVTSSVDSERFGSLALAIVKRPQNEVGNTLQTAASEAQVVALPFEIASDA